MNESGTILADRDVTQRNVVFLGSAFAWFVSPLDRAAVPCLYWAGAASIFRDGHFAFRIGSLFASDFQARLWCGYHGFDFAESEFAPVYRGFFQRFVRPSSRRLRPCDDFRVEKYPMHRERCPDCARRDANRAGVSIGERVGGRDE